METVHDSEVARSRRLDDPCIPFQFRLRFVRKRVPVGCASAACPCREPWEGGWNLPHIVQPLLRAKSALAHGHELFVPFPLLLSLGRDEKQHGNGRHGNGEQGHARDPNRVKWIHLHGRHVTPLDTGIQRVAILGFPCPQGLRKRLGFRTHQGHGQDAVVRSCRQAIHHGARLNLHTNGQIGLIFQHGQRLGQQLGIHRPLVWNLLLVQGNELIHSSHLEDGICDFPFHPSHGIIACDRLIIPDFQKGLVRIPHQDGFIFVQIPVSVFVIVIVLQGSAATIAIVGGVGCLLVGVNDKVRLGTKGAQDRLEDGLHHRGLVSRQDGKGGKAILFLGSGQNTKAHTDTAHSRHVQDRGGGRDGTGRGVAIGNGGPGRGSRRR
eukprot:scaffold55276_cov55-Attheya_sp.AAC.3